MSPLPNKHSPSYPISKEEGSQKDVLIVNRIALFADFITCPGATT